MTFGQAAGDVRLVQTLSCLGMGLGGPVRLVQSVSCLAPSGRPGWTPEEIRQNIVYRTYLCSVQILPTYVTLY